MPGHFEDEHRNGEREADPEPPRHVDEFGVRPRLAPVGASGSSAMPQIGQDPGSVLTNLRVHRAGVDRRPPAPAAAGFAGCGARYCSGSATNFSRQPAQQK